MFLEERIDWKAVFIDPKTNGTEHGLYFSRSEPAPKFNEILRVDNLEPSVLMDLCCVRKEK